MNPTLAAAPAIANEIIREVVRQDVLWGEQNHEDGTGEPEYADMAQHYKDVFAYRKSKGFPVNWFDILAEELYEAGAESDPARLREELVQIAAVATSWIAAIDRRQ